MKSKKVMHWDDERNIGNSLIVTLNYGFKFGLDTFEADHVRGFDTVKEAKEAVRDAIECKCQECKEALSKREFFSGRGGKRKGAGRPKGTHKKTVDFDMLRVNVGVRLPSYLVDWLRDQSESAGRLVEKALIETYKIKRGGK